MLINTLVAFAWAVATASCVLWSLNREGLCDIPFLPKGTGRVAEVSATTVAQEEPKEEQSDAADGKETSEGAKQKQSEAALNEEATRMSEAAEKVSESEAGAEEAEATTPSSADAVQDSSEKDGAKKDSDDAQETLEAIAHTPRPTWQGIVTASLCGVLAFVCGWITWQYAATGLDVLKLALVFVLVAGAAVIDADTHTLPNRYAFTIFAARALLLIPEFIWNRDNFGAMLVSCIAGLGIGFGMLFIVSKITHGGLGMGDAKLLGAMGFACGAYGVFFNIFYSLVFCTVLGVLALLAKKKTIKESLPFGPFIFLGLAAMLLIGTY